MKWKLIANYAGKYEVSTSGQIRNTKTGRILKLSKLGNREYLKCTLSLNGIRKTIVVHRKVAEEFLQPQGEDKEVNHKNGIKTDNNVRNLEWVTKKGNRQHAYHTLGLQGNVTKKGHNLKLQKEEIEYIKRVYKPRCKINGAIALAKKFKVHRRTIENLSKYTP